MHPFAMTMNNHFNKLATPLLSLPHYPTLRSQARRFLDAGYAEIEAADLNSFFYASMTPESRETALNVELFDEYEELNAFLCHYFVAVARNSKSEPYFGIKGGEWQYINWRKDVLLNGNMTPIQHCHKSGSPGDAWTLTRLENERSIYRRFAACCPTGSGILIHGGLSNTTRLSTLQTISAIPNLPPPVASSTRPSPRMCHTLTPLGQELCIVVGGREAPKGALDDAWVYDEGWKPVQNILNGGLYRHAAVQIGEGRVIVFGGRRNSRVSSEWLLYDHQKGWRELKCDHSPALWGASLGWSCESGILIGGVDDRGECSGIVYTWSIDSATSSVILQSWELSPQARSLTRRFGAALAHVNANDFMLVGGAASHHVIPYSDQFVLLDTMTQSIRVINIHNSAEYEPWLIGHNAGYDSKTGEIVLVGGGGVCFSFGSFWNKKVFRLSQPSNSAPLHEWKLLDEVAPVRHDSTPVQQPIQETRHLRRVRITSAAEWHAVLQSREAYILEDLDYGSCVAKWTPEYLQSAVGPEKQVIIHKTESEAMNFLSKNFKYITQPFVSFIDAVFNSTTERVYLRSVSDDAKNKPANLAEDWPSLAPDFEIPSILRGQNGIPQGSVFSTVLRVGSVGTSMWLHYDVISALVSALLIVGHGEYSDSDCRRKGSPHLPSLGRE
jgi:tRNA wybutosine-synthesizing protein 4